MPIKYIPYYPNTVEGQAILDNFARTRRVLRYRDNDKIYERIKRGMPLYDVDTIESVGNNPENLVIRGECLSACAYLKDKDIKVDLVYIDPPFASGADYAKKVYIRRNPKLAEKIAKAEEQLDIEELRSFEEKMYGDIWNKEDYLNWMYENLMAIKSIMSDTASIYVHLDWHIGHYVKILMDEVFGEDNFLNEISYGYRIQGINQKCWPRKHDTIFYYSKSDDWIFTPEKEIVIYEKPFIDTKKEEANLSLLSEKEKNEIFQKLKDNEPISDKYKSKLFNKYFSEVFVRDIWDCDNTKPIISGSQEYLGYSTQKSEGLLERIIKASSKEGMLVADFFGGSGVTAKVANDLGRKFIHVDIGINSIQTTRDRLIQSMQNSVLGDNRSELSGKNNPNTENTKNSQGSQGIDILDKSMQNSVIGDNRSELSGKNNPNTENTKNSQGSQGIDILDKSMQNSVLGDNRSELSGKNNPNTENTKNSQGFILLDIKDGVSLFRNPAQTMDKLKSLISGLCNEDSLDKFWEGAINDSKLGLVPVYIPNLLDHSTKVLDVPMMSRIINEAVPDLPDDVQQVIVYYIDIENEKELKHYIEHNIDTIVKIELRDLKQILDEVVLTDIIEYEIKQNGESWEVAIENILSDRLIKKINEYNDKKTLKGKNTTLDEAIIINSEESEIETDKEEVKSQKIFIPIEISESGLELIEYISLDCTTSAYAWTSDYEIKIDKNGYLIKNGVKTKEFWDGKVIFNKKPLRMKIRNIAGDETIINC